MLSRKPDPHHIDHKYGRFIKIAIWAIMMLIFLNYIWYIFFPKLKKSSDEALNDQRRINLHLKVIDQFGKTVPNYKVRVSYEYIPLYNRFFPLISPYKNKSYIIITDEAGNATLKTFFLRKGYDMSLDEVDRSKYVFSDRNSLKFRNESLRSKGGALLSWVDPEGKGQYVELKVLRHDAPAQLAKYRPKLKLRKDGHLEGCEAKEENIFVLDFEGNKLNRDETNGDIVVTIKNADKIISHYPGILNMHQNEVNIFRKSLLSIPLKDFESNWVWSVEIEGRNGYMLQQADNEVVTFAPDEGYKKRLIYYMAYTGYPLNVIESRLIKSGWTNVDNITNANPIDPKDDELMYKIIGGIPERFFVMRERKDKRAYGIINMSLYLEYREGIFFSSRGVFNPNGNNLWQGD